MHTFAARSRPVQAQRAPSAFAPVCRAQPALQEGDTRPCHCSDCARRGHDFGRIAVRAPQRQADMRGEGEGPERDQRADAPAAPQPLDAAPDHRMLCTASATGVALGASGPINADGAYGLRTPIQVRGAELANVLDSELVGASIDHTGSMASRPSARSNNSGFMPADNVPDDQHTSGIADHLSYFDNHGGEGSYARLQMDLHKIPNCGADTPWPIENSGYRVKRTVKAEGSKVVGIVTKTAESVTIDGHTASAGLTPKKEAKVTLRA